MEMPFHLRTLPNEALDILRFYSERATNIAYADELMDGAGLSDRGFGKAIRRLVTKTYLTMDGEQRYRLSDLGQRAVDDLTALGPEAPASQRGSHAQTIERRLIVALPTPLVAEQAVTVYVGFLEADDEHYTAEPLSLLLRLAVVNGEPAVARERSLMLGNDGSRQEFEVTAGKFTKARLRVQVYQVVDDVDEVYPAGGLYVDVDVLPPGGAVEPRFIAYGADAHFVIAD